MNTTLSHMHQLQYNICIPHNNNKFVIPRHQNHHWNHAQAHASFIREYFWHSQEIYTQTYLDNYQHYLTSATGNSSYCMTKSEMWYHLNQLKITVILKWWSHTNKKFEHITEHGFKPKLKLLDNEPSIFPKKQILKNDIAYHLVPPVTHQQNNP